MMHLVMEVPFGPECLTRFWFSQAVIDAVHEAGSKRRDPKGIVMKNLERYAKNGPWNYERGEGSPVKHEWDQVYRIRPRHGLFRIFGFYENGSRSDFVAIDAFTKRGTSLNASERERVNEVARVRKLTLWRKG